MFIFNTWLGGGGGVQALYMLMGDWGGAAREGG